MHEKKINYLEVKIDTWKCKINLNNKMKFKKERLFLIKFIKNYDEYL